MSQIDVISQGSRRNPADLMIGGSPAKYGGAGSIQGEDDRSSLMYQGTPQMGSQIVIRDLAYQDPEQARL